MLPKSLLAKFDFPISIKDSKGKCCCNLLSYLILHFSSFNAERTTEKIMYLRGASERRRSFLTRCFTWKISQTLQFQYWRTSTRCDNIFPTARSRAEQICSWSLLTTATSVDYLMSRGKNNFRFSGLLVMHILATQTISQSYLRFGMFQYQMIFPAI